MPQQKSYAHLADTSRKALQRIASGKVKIRLVPGSRIIRSDAEAEAVIKRIQSKPGLVSSLPD